MADLLPHVDGSGRGLDDGDCIHCGASGSLEQGECPVRLRAALDAANRAVVAVLRRVQTDPDVRYLLGPWSDTFRLLCEAVAAETGRPLDEVKAACSRSESHSFSNT